MTVAVVLAVYVFAEARRERAERGRRAERQRQRGRHGAGRATGDVLRAEQHSIHCLSSAAFATSWAREAASPRRRILGEVRNAAMSVSDEEICPLSSV